MRERDRERELCLMFFVCKLVQEYAYIDNASFKLVSLFVGVLGSSILIYFLLFVPENSTTEACKNESRNISGDYSKHRQVCSVKRDHFPFTSYKTTLKQLLFQFCFVA